MKRSIVIILCLGVVFLQGMENNCYSTSFCEAEIFLVQKSLCYVDSRAAIVVEGKNWHSSFKMSVHKDNSAIGTIQHIRSKKATIRDICLGGKPISTKINKPLMLITEPIVKKMDNGVFKYEINGECFDGDNPLKRELIDLELYYGALLKEALKELKVLSLEKSVAFSPVSVNLGFSPDEIMSTTVKSVIDFIKNNKNSKNKSEYKKIFLYILNESDWKKYQVRFTRAILQEHKDVLNLLCHGEIY